MSQGEERGALFFFSLGSLLAIDKATATLPGVHILKKTSNKIHQWQSMYSKNKKRNKRQLKQQQSDSHGLLDAQGVCTSIKWSLKTFLEINYSTLNSTF